LQQPRRATGEVRPRRHAGDVVHALDAAVVAHLTRMQVAQVDGREDALQQW
jgi:hypothetical protein